MRQYRLALALAALAAWAVPAAAAAPAAHGLADASARAALVQVHVPARELRGGERVELRWSALPPEVEELEILLSVDGGKHYGLRVTPECDPGAGRFLWRVPNLNTGAARVRLRLGIRGREIEAAPGECFTIAGAAGEPCADPAFHERGWWSAHDALPVTVPLGPCAESARIELPDELRAAEVPPRDAVVPAAAADAGPLAPASVSTAPPPEIRLATPARFAPLRE